MLKFFSFNFLFSGIYIKNILISSFYHFFFYNNFFFFFTLIIKKKIIIKKKKIKKLIKEFFSIYKYFFLKVQFFGKTFKWIFFKKRLKLKVQKAHKIFILIKNLKFKKKKKLKFKLRLFNRNDLPNLRIILKKIKYINIFTKKGLRILKTSLKKKKGKISGYMNKYV